MSIAETWHPWPTVDHWFTTSSYESGSHHESQLTTTWILEMILLLRGLEPTENAVDLDVSRAWLPSASLQQHDGGMMRGLRLHGYETRGLKNWCSNRGLLLSLSLWALQIDNLTQPLLGTVQHTNELVSSGRGEGDPKGCCFDFNTWSQATNIFHVADLSCRAADLVAIRCCKFARLPRPPVIY